MALSGIKVIEMLGLAPGPFCGTILSDFGASVTVIQKLTNAGPIDVLSNGKKVISVNIKTPQGVDIVRKLCANSDVLLDTFRPGVMEKLNLGPQILLKHNPRLIYARLTGYGQDGCFKNTAGHDINYVAMSGILSMLSKNKLPPSPPLNIIADFGGGSVLCTLGIVIALFERSKSGKGQVIDASMTEGAAYMATWIFKSQKSPIWGREPGYNILDGGLPYYNTYKTKDGKFMAVGSLEPQFYVNFLKGLNLPEDTNIAFDEFEKYKVEIQKVFLTKTQEEWCAIFKNLEACVTPVLDIDSVDNHECNKSRKSFYRDDNDLLIPEPAPRLSNTPAVSSGKQKATQPGQHTIQILQELGYSEIEINNLILNNCVGISTKSSL